MSINLVLGDNGIITRAKEAKKTYGEEAIREKVTLLLSEYVADNYDNDKQLKEYLQEQENVEKIESVEDNEDETYTITIDDYFVTIDKETLEILEIEKTGPRPKISNIKVMVINPEDGTEREVGEHEVEVGTPLKVIFDVSFEEGSLEKVNKGTLINGKVEYTTDGTEKEINFSVTGKIGQEERTKRQRVSLEKYYRILVEKITLDKDSIEMQVGEMQKLEIKSILPEDATNKTIVWSSNPEGIVKVENGVVTAINRGECVVTASSCDDSDVVGTCNVAVKGGQVYLYKEGIDNFEITGGLIGRFQSGESIEFGGTKKSDGASISFLSDRIELNFVQHGNQGRGVFTRKAINFSYFSKLCIDFVPGTESGAPYLTWEIEAFKKCPNSYCGGGSGEVVASSNEKSAKRDTHKFPIEKFAGWRYFAITSGSLGSTKIYNIWLE